MDRFIRFAFSDYGAAPHKPISPIRRHHKVAKLQRFATKSLSESKKSVRQSCSNGKVSFGSKISYQFPAKPITTQTK
jgi:hypothetical protein